MVHISYFSGVYILTPQAQNSKAILINNGLQEIEDHIDDTDQRHPIGKH
jgi:hypothetical protein